MKLRQSDKIDSTLLLGWCTLSAILFVGYLIEVINGRHTIAYFCIFTVFDMVMPAVVAFLYFHVRSIFGVKVREIIISCYLFMYLFVMLTTNTELVYVYIIPMLFVLVVCHQPWFIMRTGFAAMGINIVTEVPRYWGKQITADDFTKLEIQFFLIAFCFGFAFVVARIFDNIEERNQTNTKELRQKNFEMQNMTMHTISTIANTIDAKDEYTKGHSKRVAEYSVRLAAELGMSWEDQSSLRYSALLHDIGKIGVPDAVLCKPGRLTDEEFKLMKNHTTIGADILKDFDVVKGLDIGAKYHHERYDGRGYPNGISGEDIPYTARIIGICDAYDAMTSTRVYRKCLSNDEVIAEIEKGAGTQFDPEIAKAFVGMLRSKTFKNMSPNMLEFSAEEEAETRLIQKLFEMGAEQGERRAQLDPLTAVYTKVVGDQLVKEALRGNFGLLFLFRVDNMRSINTNLGFVKGDSLLQQMVKEIVELDTDLIIYRYSGSTIASFSKNLTSAQQAHQISEAFFAAMETYKKEYPEYADVSFSVGVANGHDFRADYDKMALGAEKALYLAQQTGENQVIVYNENSSGTGKLSGVYRVDLEQFLDYLNLNEVGQKEVERRYSSYEYLHRYLDEFIANEGNNIHMILFTLVPAVMESVEASNWDIAMHALEEAVKFTAQVSCMCLPFSNTQRVLILPTQKQDIMDQLPDTILKNFYKMYGKDLFSLHYDQTVYEA